MNLTEILRSDIETIDSGDDFFYGVYKGYTIDISRENAGGNFYIVVDTPEGHNIHDGYWRDSSSKGIDDALQEALWWLGLSLKTI